VGKTNEKRKESGALSTTLIIVLIAVVSITAATIAWFSIADKTRLSNMKMDVSAGYCLRFDLDKHDTYEAYSQTLTYEDIAKRVLKDSGIDMNELSLEPVTTEDAKKFIYENGKESLAEDGNYYEFTLHFMSNEDMNVHLTSANGKKGVDGTKISSENNGTPNALRIAFLSKDGTMVYDPGMDGKSIKSQKMTTFGLYPQDKMKYNESNMLFYIPANTDIPVTVRIWVEGTDEDCNNSIKDSDFSLRLRFEGTDENFNVLSTEK